MTGYNEPDASIRDALKDPQVVELLADITDRLAAV